MIEFVRGKVVEKEVTRVILEVQGMGYTINIPLSTYEKLPDCGCEVLLHTFFYVMEDA